MNQELRIMVKKAKSIIHDSLFMIHSRGFTLIELLIAISIIGVLSSFLLANFVGVRQRARDGVRKSDLRQIQSALELFRSDQGHYSQVSLDQSFLKCGCVINSAWGVQCGSPEGTIYMKKIPCDPSNGAQYAYSSDSMTYSIIACLENGNDSQKDAVSVSPCNGTTNFSYTLQNP